MAFDYAGPKIYSWVLLIVLEDLSPTFSPWKGWLDPTHSIYLSIIALIDMVSNPIQLYKEIVDQSKKLKNF